MKDSQKQEADELLDLALSLSRTHLASLKQKLESGATLTPNEGISLCNYMKTLGGIKKIMDAEKMMKNKVVSKMTDEELQAELKKYMLPELEEKDESEEEEL